MATAPLKILIISDAWHPQVNGVVRTYEHIRDTLEQQGHTIHIIGPHDFPRHRPMPGYAEIHLAIFPYKTLKQKIRQFAPDAIHIATEGPLGWAARKYCLRHKLSFTTCYHTQFPDYLAERVAKLVPFLKGVTHKMGVNFIKKFHSPATAILTGTKSMKEQLQQWGIALPIRTYTRGVDLDLFQYGEKTLFHDLPKPVALYVGRIAIEKNIEEFLQMPWQGSKVIVGHGPDLEMLKSKYPAAHFTGKKTGAELAAHYRSADLFAFPSVTDTFGIVLIEALACGLPIAAHDAIGPRDIVTNKILGCLHADLSTAAQQALLHGSAEQRRNHVINTYSWELAAQQFLSALKHKNA